MFVLFYISLFFFSCSWSQILETLPLPNVSTCLFLVINKMKNEGMSYKCINISSCKSWLGLIHIYMMQIKWICPTSPVQPLTFLGGLSTTACMLFWCFANIILFFNNNQYFIIFQIKRNVLFLFFLQIINPELLFYH